MPLWLLYYTCQQNPNIELYWTFSKHLGFGIGRSSSFCCCCFFRGAANLTIYMKSSYFEIKIKCWQTSLLVQWLRICLPMQGIRVQFLVQDDSTCLGEAKPMYHNYWACEHPRACALQQEKAPQWETCTPQLDRSSCLPQLARSPRAVTTTQCSQKIN